MRRQQRTIEHPAGPWPEGWLPRLPCDEDAESEWVAEVLDAYVAHSEDGEEAARLAAAKKAKDRPSS